MIFNLFIERTLKRTLNQGFIKHNYSANGRGIFCRVRVERLVMLFN